MAMQAESPQSLPMASVDQNTSDVRQHDEEEASPPSVENRTPPGPPSVSTLTEDDINVVHPADAISPATDKSVASPIEIIREVSPSDSLERPHQRVETEETEHSDDTGVSEKPSRLPIHWKKSNDPQAGIYGYIPGSIIFLAACGLFGALGHHLYNQHLDGKEVKNVQWPQRFGFALALFIKMVLVGSVQLSFKQRAWLSVKKRNFKVKTLDSIFHSCYDPAEFLDHELFRGAFLPALLALLCWILPLSAIASPSTLSPADGAKVMSTTCSNVSTLDFRRENGYGLDDRQPDVNKQAMSYWDMFDNGTYYFAAPSMDHRKLFQLSMLSTSPLQPANPCPSDSNCTYSISFLAPSYKCEERSRFDGPPGSNFSQLAPYGDLLYASYSSDEEDSDGTPVDWNTTVLNNDTGVFKTEPSLWVGWIINTTLPATAENASSWNTSYWRHQLVPHVMECIMYNSTYEYTLSFAQGEMSVNRSHVVPNTPMLPKGAIVAPYMDIYQEFAGFHGSGYLYRNLLAGNLTMAGQDSWVITYSDISETELLDPGSGLPLSPDVPGTIEAGFQSIYLSLLSDVVQYSQIFVDAPCTVTSHVLVWRYEPLWLVVPYIVAIVLTFAAAAVGLHAIAVNGYCAQTNFSTFMMTTRNPDLQDLARGSCLGAWPMKKEVRETRLRFGETVAGSGDEHGVAHAAFGFPGQVTTLVRGKKYE